MVCGWSECSRTACELDNLDCDNKSGKHRYVLFHGKDYKGFPYLKKFGEIGIVTQVNAIKNKLVNCGEACLYLGHAENHSAEVARFMKLSTKRVIRSRDVKWLNQNFQDYQESQGFYNEEEYYEYDNGSDSEEETYNNEEKYPMESDIETHNEPIKGVSHFQLSHTIRLGLQFAPFENTNE